MKTKAKQALVELNNSQLHKKLREVEEAFLKAKLERRTGRSANTSLVSRLGDEIAHIKFLVAQNLESSAGQTEAES